jgi:AN1-like Zinc finger
MASEAANHHLNQLNTNSAVSSKDASPSLSHRAHYATPGNILDMQNGHFSAGFLHAGGSTHASTLTAAVLGATPTLCPSSLSPLETSINLSSQAASIPTAQDSPDKSGVFPTAAAACSLPIPIPTMHSPACHQDSNATIFQQVTPFGTPSVSSLAASLANQTPFLPPPSAPNQPSAFFPSSGYDMTPNYESKLPFNSDVVKAVDASSSIAVSLPTTSSSSLLTRAKTTSAATSTTKCPIINCHDKIAKIIGHCKYCQHHFCSLHRLPEQHQCSRIGDLKLASFNRNSEKLFKEKCVADKV